MDQRLAQQIDFVMELDRLKSVIRQNQTPSAQRRENTAEHSWHLAMMGWVLEDQSPVAVDCAKVLCMLLLHDVVEIDAGDTFAYDETEHDDKALRGGASSGPDFWFAASRPSQDFRAVWDEFEAGQSPEALLARALDRLQPILLNHRCGADSSWAKHGISKAQVLKRNVEVSPEPCALGAPQPLLRRRSRRWLPQSPRLAGLQTDLAAHLGALTAAHIDPRHDEPPLMSDHARRALPRA